MANGDRWYAPDLTGRVALVAGASKGVGRGIAEVLGGAGATVYVAARSSGAPTSRDGPTVESVAADVSAAGGVGKPVVCDLGDDSRVRTLCARIGTDDGRLDVVVVNAVGWADVDTDVPPASAEEARRSRIAWWDANFTVGVRSSYVLTQYVLGLMQPRGTILFTSEQPVDEPIADPVLDLRAHVTARMVRILASRLAGRDISVFGLCPGFPRTEVVLERYRRRHPYFNGWTDEDFTERTESVHYAGRAVASLVADPSRFSSGSTLRVLDVARKYGFTDVDGRQPRPLVDAGG